MSGEGPIEDLTTAGSYCAQQCTWGDRPGTIPVTTADRIGVLVAARSPGWPQTRLVLEVRNQSNDQPHRPGFQKAYHRRVRAAAGPARQVQPDGGDRGHKPAGTRRDDDQHICR